MAPPMQDDHVLILGGDGFCGWPVALSLSANGYDVTIVDNLSRRRIDEELGTAPLIPIGSPAGRLNTWHSVTNKKIAFHEIDIAQDYDRFRDLLAEVRPGAVVHLAEQRSAPYSTLSPAARHYTVTNNLTATHAVLIALTELGLDSHMVHLGSIGVFGYTTADMELPEGYVPATLRGTDGREVEMEILYPGKPVSVYHMTKAQDQLLFEHYARTEGIRITDLNQGVVWGHATAETDMHPGLATRYDTDAVYGTVVNRFLKQAATGQPLSVYGSGGQTRGFIHLRDVTHCIRLALQDPPARGDRFQMFNQMTESVSIKDLAAHVAAVTGAEVENRPNPRKEPESNEFQVKAIGLQNLGLEPTLFKDQLSHEAQAVKAAIAGLA